MANWILPLVVAITLVLAWSNRGDHARNACFRLVAPLLPTTARASDSSGDWREEERQNAAQAKQPGAWKAVAEFCDALADNGSTPQ